MADILQSVGIRSSSTEVYKALTTRDGLASGDGHDIGGFEMKVLMRDPAKRVSLVETGKRSPNPGDIKIDSLN